MKAMILAAGLGNRMRPLTNTTPKPLLPVGGRPLLEHHILRLKAEGITDLVINAAYLSEQIVAFCGDGRRWGVTIALSVEPEPLETAGGIIQALPLLGDAPFIVVNGDIWCPFPFGQLRECLLPDRGANLVLVNNPAHNPAGDFSLKSGQVVSSCGETLTFSGIARYSPTFFNGCDTGKRPLKPLLDSAIAENRLVGQRWSGDWEDVGTPDRLAHLDERIRAES